MRFSAPGRSYDGYIFDCDGTLIDSMPLHFRAWRQSLRESGARFEFGWELFTSRAGMPLVETVLALNEQFGTELSPTRVVEAQRRLFRSLLPELRAIDVVLDYARRVAQLAPTGVASGGHRPEVEESLRLVGAGDLFRCIVTGSDVSRGKPDPEILLRCAEGLGVAPERCLVVEDGELGIEAARRAGMDWVRVEAAPGAVG
jgi:HAD superfamily hydrolase (TIGR01509 family)